MKQWLVKAYLRTGRHDEKERVLSSNVVSPDQVGEEISTAIRFGASELLVIEVDLFKKKEKIAQDLIPTKGV